MLIDFCQKRVKPAVFCSTVSNDGYEVTNLINDSDKGFLVYSCIKPPIHIDFTFICDVRLSRVLIWPSVGAQKSSGFELCVKSASDLPADYKKVATGYLDSSHTGVFFYRRDIAENDFGVYPSFLQRYIQVGNSRVVDNVRNLRISILRTENSVPAIGRIQVWGRVSQSCGRAITTNVHSLWESNRIRHPEVEVKNVSEKKQDRTENVPEKSSRKPGEEEEALNVPECFLDPITWSVMTQPIVLPSGVTIDQSTLEKHAKTEATWGRALSDPFTGIPFSETRKPIVASALKAQIDKFLLDNQHAPDVKSLPRSSGYKRVLASLRNRSVQLSGIMSEACAPPKSSSNLDDKNLEKSAPELKSRPKVQQEESRVHRLPVVAVCSKRVAVAKRNSRTLKIKPVTRLAIKNDIESGIPRLRPVDCSNTDSNLDHNVQTVLSGLQRFDEEKRAIVRECVNGCACSSRIFYKLPCDHVVCRDVLTSAKSSECAICGATYSSRDPVRFHASLSLD